MEDHLDPLQSRPEGNHPAKSPRSESAFLFFPLMAITIIAMLAGIYFLINIYAGRPVPGDGRALPYILAVLIYALSLFLSGRMDRKGHRMHAVSILNSGLFLGIAVFLLSMYFFD